LFGIGTRASQCSPFNNKIHQKYPSLSKKYLFCIIVSLFLNIISRKTADQTQKLNHNEILFLSLPNKNKIFFGAEKKLGKILHSDSDSEGLLFCYFMFF
jgi:hypothetical protein